MHAGGLTWSEGVSVLAQLAVFLAAVLEPLHQAAHTHSNHRTSQLPCYVMQPQNISTPMLCHATTEHLNSHVMSCNHRTTQLPCYVYATTEHLNSHVYVSATTEHISSHVMSLQPQNISTPMLCLWNHKTAQLSCYVHVTTEHL